MVTEEKLEANIEFRARVPREEMPALLHDFDALILPSIYEEPLARIAQEAMASGVILIGTLTGGTKELLLDGENGLAFMPEDPHGLAAQIERLLKDQELAQRLRLAGLNTIDERFSIERMVNEIESYLAETVRQEPG
jgi:glycosyltransferase involved in cell wall biosynthesis